MFLMFTSAHSRRGRFSKGSIFSATAVGSACGEVDLDGRRLGPLELLAPALPMTDAVADGVDDDP